MMLTDVGDAAASAGLSVNVAGLLEMSSSVLSFITGNPLLFTMFAGSLVGVACYVVCKIKKTAKV